jgi:hypothetical protein
MYDSHRAANHNLAATASTGATADRIDHHSAVQRSIQDGRAWRYLHRYAIGLEANRAFLRDSS